MRQAENPSINRAFQGGRHVAALFLAGSQAAAPEEAQVAAAETAALAWLALADSGEYG